MNQIQAVFNSLAPTLFIILLGAGLARRGFLGAGFLEDLNRLAFYICLPCFVYSSMAASEVSFATAVNPLKVMLATTFLACCIAGLWGHSRRLSGGELGTFMQAGFRGNLAFIGLPILTYALQGMHIPGAGDIPGMAVLIIVPTMIVYNVLSVVCLQGVRGLKQKEARWKLLASIMKNPLVIALVLGLISGYAQMETPLFLNRAIVSLGSAAAPIALLCIGGSMALAGRGRHWGLSVEAALCKTVLVPLIALAGCYAFGLSPREMFVVMLLASTPVAGASYIMARQMGGDEKLAAGAIVLSTLFSIIPLSLVILLAVRWLT